MTGLAVGLAVESSVGCLAVGRDGLAVGITERILAVVREVLAERLAVDLVELYGLSRNLVWRIRELVARRSVRECWLANVRKCGKKKVSVNQPAALSKVRLRICEP